MSRIVSALVVTAAALSLTAASRADGLVYQLPKDGTWAQYDLTFKATRGDQAREVTGTVRVASVGKAMEDGKDCRWIEFRLDLEPPDGNNRTILGKVLVPEEHLQAGKSPIDHIVRGWVKLPDSDEAVKLSDENRGPLPIFLAGPGKDHQKLEAATIPNEKLGELKAGGARGTIEYQENGRSLAADYETRTHEKSSFGVVTAKFDVRGADQTDSFGTATLTLSDMGESALSDLPNQK
jgi:hypothetical protein